ISPGERNNTPRPNIPGMDLVKPKRVKAGGTVRLVAPSLSASVIEPMAQTLGSITLADRDGATRRTVPPAFTRFGLTRSMPGILGLGVLFLSPGDMAIRPDRPSTCPRGA